MNRPLSAIFAALDALITVAIGLGVPLLFSTLLWALHFGLVIDWLVFWRTAADMWLLGNGVDVRFQLEATLAGALSLPGAADPFVVSLAPMGFTLLTFLLGRRSGIRLATSSAAPITGAFAGIATVSILAGLVALSATVPAAAPDLVQAFVIVPLVYGGGVALGLFLPGRATTRAASWNATRSSPEWWTRLQDTLRAVVPAWLLDSARLGVRMGAIAAAAVMFVASLTVVLLLLWSFADIITLYESSQAGILGGVTITAIELTLIPNTVAWAMSWLVGPGFALGVGSQFSPIATHAGLIPSLPLFGALPDGTGPGIVALLVPVAAAFLAGALMRTRWTATNRSGWKATVCGVVFGALVGACILALIAAWSAGAAGPGRLAEVGPDGLAVLVWGLVELALGLTAGLFVPLVTPRIPRWKPGRKEPSASHSEDK